MSVGSVFDLWSENRPPLPYGPRRLGRDSWAYFRSAIALFIPRVLRCTPGADPHAGSNRAAIYVSFDSGSVVQTHVLAQIAALSATNHRVIFIWHAKNLSPEAIRLVGPHVREIVHRRNLGHDFGGYRDGLSRLKPGSDLHSVILMNDSCLGPFNELGPILAAAEDSSFGLYGITESHALGYHVQSYFLWIRGHVTQLPAFARFWRSMLLVQPRSMVIERGEVKFTQAMQRAGVPVGVFCPYARAAELAREASVRRLRQRQNEADQAYSVKLIQEIDARTPLNPIHAFWDVLIQEMGCPFLKRDLAKREFMGQPAQDVADFLRQTATTNAEAKIR